MPSRLHPELALQEVPVEAPCCHPEPSAATAAVVAPIKTTLLDLVRAVQEYAASDLEVVAVIVHMIQTNKVELCGTFKGTRELH